jgi:hypothetical protein
MTTQECACQPAVLNQPVRDPAAWTADDLASDQGWIYQLTEGDIAELDAAVRAIEDRGLDILEITKTDFVVPSFARRLDAICEDIIHGRGLAVIRGVPVERYTRRQAAIAFWGMGLFMGVPVSQNAKGHLLGHVADLGGTTLANPSNRGYQTHEALPFHNDSCDVVALLCLHPAKSGGESRVTSSLSIYNEMCARRPELVEELAAPIYRDRRNEIPEGKDPWYQLPVFNFYEGYLTVSMSGGYIKSAQRFKELPRHSALLKEALDLFAQLSQELAYGMEFRQGDMQLLHNHVTVHSRTDFEDYPEPERKRNLLRLWLATPGGRPLPPGFAERYGDLPDGTRPAGGIMIPGTTLKAPLYPE